MDKVYDHKKYEDKIYKLWDKSGAFAPKKDPKKKPYTIILPPPNASGKMHMGNVLMIAVEDLLIRRKRMQGIPTLWLPGTDHAGIETQTTFERELKKKGESRFDFDRQTLYDLIWQYVQDNKGLILQQFREMGASIDWSRMKFTLDPDVITTIYGTFEKMEKEGLVYRGDYLVNYSFKHGTTFSDAEVQYKEQVDPLYYIRYPLMNRQKNEPEFLVIATVRPEPIMIDTHLAVNPKDKKNKKWTGRKVRNPVTDVLMDIIADPFVDVNFGTGIVKLTPGHDKTDYQVALKRKDVEIPIKSVIDWNGKINENAIPELRGKTILEARNMIVEMLQNKGLIEKIDENYTHQVPVDYRSGDYIENLVLPNWFIKVNDKKRSLKKPAYEAVKKGRIKIYPKWREITYLRWMENLHDWAISRQNVWGIRIPVWYEVQKDASNIWVYWLDKNKELKQGTINQFLEKGVSLDEIKRGLQRVFALPNVKYKISDKEPRLSKNKDMVGYLPETDTFDTWFSSGQWPLVTLGYPDSSDFKYFYPTDVLETGWEIVTRWVSRMVMFGIYLTGKVPFYNVYLHGHVRAVDGRKMSKSLGNVINPEEYQKEYGTDALRMGLIAGTAGGKDFSFPHDKIIAYRNFANKIWNMARFIQLMISDWEKESDKKLSLYDNTKFSGRLTEDDKKILVELNKLVKSVDTKLSKYKFAQASDEIYHFMWDKLASDYLEKIKGRNDKETALSIFRHLYLNSLKLLHPFMPFVTEAIWQEIITEDFHERVLAAASWPKTN